MKKSNKLQNSNQEQDIFKDIYKYLDSQQVKNENILLDLLNEEIEKPYSEKLNNIIIELLQKKYFIKFLTKYHEIQNHNKQDVIKQTLSKQIIDNLNSLCHNIKFETNIIDSQKKYITIFDIILAYGKIDCLLEIINLVGENNKIKGYKILLESIVELPIGTALSSYIDEKNLLIFLKNFANSDNILLHKNSLPITEDVNNIYYKGFVKLYNEQLDSKKTNLLALTTNFFHADNIISQYYSFNNKQEMEKILIKNISKLWNIFVILYNNLDQDIFDIDLNQFNNRSIWETILNYHNKKTLKKLMDNLIPLNKLMLLKSSIIDIDDQKYMIRDIFSHMLYNLKGDFATMLPFFKNNNKNTVKTSPEYPSVCYENRIDGFRDLLAKTEKANIDLLNMISCQLKEQDLLQFIMSFVKNEPITNLRAIKSLANFDLNLLYYILKNKKITEIQLILSHIGNFYRFNDSIKIDEKQINNVTKGLLVLTIAKKDQYDTLSPAFLSYHLNKYEIDEYDLYQDSGYIYELILSLSETSNINEAMNILFHQFDEYDNISLIKNLIYSAYRAVNEQNIIKYWYNITNFSDKKFNLSLIEHWINNIYHNKAGKAYAAKKFVDSLDQIASIDKLICIKYIDNQNNILKYLTSNIDIEFFIEFIIYYHKKYHYNSLDSYCDMDHKDEICKTQWTKFLKGLEKISLNKTSEANNSITILDYMAQSGNFMNCFIDYLINKKINIVNIVINFLKIEDINQNNLFELVSKYEHHQFLERILQMSDGGNIVSSLHNLEKHNLLSDLIKSIYKYDNEYIANFIHQDCLTKLFITNEDISTIIPILKSLNIFNNEKFHFNIWKILIKTNSKDIISILKSPIIENIYLTDQNNNKNIIKRDDPEDGFMILSTNEKSNKSYKDIINHNINHIYNSINKQDFIWLLNNLTYQQYDELFFHWAKEVILNKEETEYIQHIKTLQYLKNSKTTEATDNKNKIDITEKKKDNLKENIQYINLTKKILIDKFISITQDNQELIDNISDYIDHYHINFSWSQIEDHNLIACKKHLAYYIEFDSVTN